MTLLRTGLILAAASRTTTSYVIPGDETRLFSDPLSGDGDDEEGGETDGELSETFDWAVTGDLGRDPIGLKLTGGEEVLAGDPEFDEEYMEELLDTFLNVTT